MTLVTLIGCLLVSVVWLGTTSTGLPAPRLVSISSNEAQAIASRAGASSEVHAVLPAADRDGLRVLLRDGTLLEAKCDGSIEERRLPSRHARVEASGSAFAWYDDGKWHFTHDPAGLTGDPFWVDPTGRYFLIGDVWKPGGTRHVMVARVADQSVIGASPLLGSQVRLFVSEEGFVIVAPEEDHLVEVRMHANGGKLEEVARREIRPPWTLLGGRLLPLDRNPDTGALLLTLKRDPPFRSVLYEVASRRDVMKKRGIERGYSFYARCNPTYAGAE